MWASVSSGVAKKRKNIKKIDSLRILKMILPFCSIITRRNIEDNFVVLLKSLKYGYFVIGVT